MRRTILDLCAGSGAWSAPYQAAGYDVHLITLPECDVRRYRDAFEQVRFPVHGILAAPPCDHFSVSGAQYWPAKDKDGRTAEALEIVDACLEIVMAADPVWWCMENPVGRLRGLRGHVLSDLCGTKKGAPMWTFNPCDYGDPYTKKTLLWGRFRPPTPKPVKPERVCTQGSWLQKLGGKSEKTKRLRSVTPPGFARAFFEANP